jgi:DNA-binding beta-propeller fold protein YncE
VNATFPAFDGSNIWVPNKGSATVTVVRASTGAVLQTLSGNGLVQPLEAAFDGQRILVTNNNGNTVSLFKAADLSSAGFLLIGGTPTGVCSDGVSFWIALSSGGTIARF